MAGAGTTITTRVNGRTIETIVFRTRRAYRRGFVEATLDTNRGLSALPIRLPKGSTVVVPDPGQDPAFEIPIIRLQD